MRSPLLVALGVLHRWLSQDVARANAASAAARMLRRRQEHTDVDRYLAQRR